MPTTTQRNPASQSKPSTTSVRENEIENTNATRGNVHTIHKYTLTDTLNILQTNKQKQAWGKDKYENAHIQAVAIEFSTTFVWLILLDYKRAIQSTRQSVRIQLALCEIAIEPNGCMFEHLRCVQNSE